MNDASSNRAGREPNGPIAQSIAIAFGALRVAMVLLAVFWAMSNIRVVPPGTQAIVLLFGQIVRTQQAGLMLAWPRPIELVELLPSTERQLNLPIAAEIKVGNAIVDPVSRVTGGTPPDTVGAYLTGDGGVVLLDATLTYRIVDARAYYLEAAHVAPVLRRVFLASAVAVAAQRGMDDFLVVRGGAADDTDRQARREDMRGALVREVNRRLQALQPRDAGIGIEVTRADITALLPPAAKFAFDAVLDATQMAEQGLAAARTDAARAHQAADQGRDRILTEAHASADERVATAKAHVAAITALEQRMEPAGRPSLLDQLYRERIAGILKQAGAVSTVDLRGGGRLILPAGSMPGSP
jgi:regulator of protease activity HflC (stomatin/prohibitin superfamily)